MAERRGAWRLPSPSAHCVRGVQQCFVQLQQNITGKQPVQEEAGKRQRLGESGPGGRRGGSAEGLQKGGAAGRGSRANKKEGWCGEGENTRGAGDAWHNKMAARGGSCLPATTPAGVQLGGRGRGVAAAQGGTGIFAVLKTRKGENEIGAGGWSLSGAFSKERWHRPGRGGGGKEGPRSGGWA